MTAPPDDSRNTVANEPRPPATIRLSGALFLGLGFLMAVGLSSRFTSLSPSTGDSRLFVIEMLLIVPLLIAPGVGLRKKWRGAFIWALVTGGLLVLSGLALLLVSPGVGSLVVLLIFFTPVFPLLLPVSWRWALRRGAWARAGYARSEGALSPRVAPPPPALIPPPPQATPVVQRETPPVNPVRRSPGWLVLTGIGAVVAGVAAVVVWVAVASDSRRPTIVTPSTAAGSPSLTGPTPTGSAPTLEPGDIQAIRRMATDVGAWNRASTPFVVALLDESVGATRFLGIAVRTQEQLERVVRRMKRHASLAKTPSFAVACARIADQKGEELGGVRKVTRAVLFGDTRLFNEGFQDIRQASREGARILARTFDPLLEPYGLSVEDVIEAAA
jgi:hypothetical protein